MILRNQALPSSPPGCIHANLSHFFMAIPPHPAFFQLQPNLFIRICLHQKWGILTKGEDGWQGGSEENPMLFQTGPSMCWKDRGMQWAERRDPWSILLRWVASALLLQRKFRIFLWLELTPSLVLAQVLQCWQVWIRDRIMKVRTKVHLAPFLENAFWFQSQWSRPIHRRWGGSVEEVCILGTGGPDFKVQPWLFRRC